jgi:hypothetical protein
VFPASDEFRHRVFLCRAAADPYGGSSAAEVYELPPRIPDLSQHLTLLAPSSYTRSMSRSPYVYICLQGERVQPFI